MHGTQCVRALFQLCRQRRTFGVDADNRVVVDCILQWLFTRVLLGLQLLLDRVLLQLLELLL